LLGVPHISLDELYWKPGWKQSTPEEFQAKIRQKLDQGDKGWVVDGDYEKSSDGVVVRESTDVICMYSNFEEVLTSIDIIGIPRARSSPLTIFPSHLLPHHASLGRATPTL
jgi:adenylate kinase family enzyme